MQGHDWHSRTVHMYILAADFYNLRREDAQYQGMQSRDSCVQREQAPALRYCLQEP